MSWPPPPISIASPLAFFKVTTSGRTQPLGIRCETSNGAEDYIVKLRTSVELQEHSLVREIYGACLAHFFDLQTPSIVWVDIPPEFPSIQPDKQVCQRLNSSLGLNFGSKYIPGAKIFSHPVSVTHSSIAVRIYCFDMLIGNLDRRHPVINLFETNDSFILYDHEQAFPFSKPQTMLGGYPPSWKFIKEDWACAHIFYPSLKKKSCDLEIEDFITTLTSLTDDVFATIEEQIPTEWQTPDLQKIHQYLTDTRQNANLFKRSLQELLA